jgi:hypothetical protein
VRLRVSPAYPHFDRVEVTGGAEALSRNICSGLRLPGAKSIRYFAVHRPVRES